MEAMSAGTPQASARRHPESPLSSSVQTIATVSPSGPPFLPVQCTGGCHSRNQRNTDHAPHSHSKHPQDACDQKRKRKRKEWPFLCQAELHGCKEPLGSSPHLPVPLYQGSAAGLGVPPVSSRHFPALWKSISPSPLSLSLSHFCPCSSSNGRLQQQVHLITEPNSACQRGPISQVPPSLRCPTAHSNPATATSLYAPAHPPSRSLLSGTCSHADSSSWGKGGLGTKTVK